jgi:Mn2+/Fe2+ NRAMP family transporter
MLFIVASSLFVMIVPNTLLLAIMVLSQVLNGVLLPVILIFVLLVTNDRLVMGNYKNSRVFNVIAACAVAGLIIMTVLLLASPLIAKMVDG